MKKMYLLVIVSLTLLSGCTDPETAVRVLESQGMSDIRMTGHDFWGCSEDDSYHTGFEATSVSGHHVSGTVCSSMFGKGATVRFN